MFFVLWFCFLNLFCLVLDRVMVSSSCFVRCPGSLFLNLLFVLDVVRCYDVFFGCFALVMCVLFLFLFLDVFFVLVVVWPIVRVFVYVCSCYPFCSLPCVLNPCSLFFVLDLGLCFS